jgi:ABC-type dipeptide/oligopeptide/nickel transport system permease component
MPLPVATVTLSWAAERAVLTETVFNLAGIGRTLFSRLRQDTPWCRPSRWPWRSSA